MDDDPDEKFVIGSIPEGGAVTEALGRFFAEFASLEFALLLVFAILLGHGNNNDIAGAIFKRVRNIADRIHILRDTVRAGKWPPLVIDAIDALCELFEGVNARRNVYAHGVYEWSDSGKIRIKTYVMTAGRKQTTEILEAKRIQQDIGLAQAALVFALTWAGKISPEELREASREKSGSKPSRQPASHRGGQRPPNPRRSSRK
jgi:uncharacterized membrane protein YphA (DoxX/SURF4 family)